MKEILDKKSGKLEKCRENLINLKIFFKNSEKNQER